MHSLLPVLAGLIVAVVVAGVLIRIYREMATRWTG